MTTENRGYRTKQRAELIAFLEANKGEHMSARVLCDRMAQVGIEIGTATVYRQLEALVKEGLVRKYIIDESGPACFEYVGENDSCEDEHCFHCLCTQCGTLYHVECNHLAGIGDHLLSDHGFTIDPQRTVFYGVCKDCANQGQETDIEQK